MRKHVQLHTARHVYLFQQHLKKDIYAKCFSSLYLKKVKLLFNTHNTHVDKIQPGNLADTEVSVYSRYTSRNKEQCHGTSFQVLIMTYEGIFQRTDEQHMIPIQ